jgi:hypothetical protein
MKDHLNWELIGEAAKQLKGPQGKALEEAYGEVEEQEDEHLYHTKGWTRELWLKSLGAPAILPPPEERRDVKSEMEAARAKASRTRMLKGSSAGRAAASHEGSSPRRRSSPAQRRASPSQRRNSSARAGSSSAGPRRPAAARGR